MMVRCFAALPVPDASRTGLDRALARFRDGEWRVRWVRPEGVHVNLRFYGEVPMERAEAIAESIDFAVRGIGPLPLTLSGFGAFPDTARARVLWAGVDAPAALELLQDRIEVRAEELGFPSEGGVYRPHVTIGRVREGERVARPEVERFSAVPLSISFIADRVVLFQSTLESGGASYSTLHESVLRG